MEKLKINIIFSFYEDSWGGANQFLKALKNSLEKKSLYEKNPNKADCFIFNSHHNIDEVLKLKLKYQDKIFIHRMAAPIYLYRPNNSYLDYMIYELNKCVANGTIFQSEWSKNMSLKNGFKRSTILKVVHNAPDLKYFYHAENKKVNNWENKKCLLLATSWSKNIQKGFNLYKYLDDKLDFKKYSMEFIGNSPFKFKNIKHIKTINSEKLGQFLRERDIFIFGAINETCSNSLLEALSCGLPCVGINHASNPELIKRGGELFETYEECINKINLVKSNYNFYKNNISIQNIDKITNEYLNFIEQIRLLLSLNKCKPKKLRLYDYYKLLLKYYHIKAFIINIILKKSIKFIFNFEKKVKK